MLKVFRKCHKQISHLRKVKTRQQLAPGTEKPCQWDHCVAPGASEHAAAQWTVLGCERRGHLHLPYEEQRTERKMNWHQRQTYYSSLADKLDTFYFIYLFFKKKVSRCNIIWKSKYTFWLSKLYILVELLHKCVLVTVHVMSWTEHSRGK